LLILFEIGGNFHTNELKLLFYIFTKVHKTVVIIQNITVTKRAHLPRLTPAAKAKGKVVPALF